jgi:hypothetical protein
MSNAVIPKKAWADSKKWAEMSVIARIELLNQGNVNTPIASNILMDAALSDDSPELVAACHKYFERWWFSFGEEVPELFERMRKLWRYQRDTTAAYIRLAKEAFPEIKELGPIDVNAIEEDDNYLPILILKLRHAFPDEPELQGEALHIEEVGAFLERKARERRQSEAKARKRTLLPAKLPQSTMPETRQLTRAIVDGASGNCWNQKRGEVAFFHAVDRAPMQVLFVPPDLSIWGVQAPSYEHLERLLKSLDLRAVLVFHCVVAWIIKEGELEIELDDLIRLMKGRPRNVEERAAMRAELWQWLNIFSRMQVIGERRESYTDSLTNKKLDLTTRDPLFTVTREVVEVKDARSTSKPPFGIVLTPGAWLESVRANPKVCQYYNDMLLLAGLGTGKAAGAWASAIGVALNQFWREDVTKRELKHSYPNGEKQTVVRFKTYTRRELLSLLPQGEFSVEAILNGNDPKRAKKYWDEAIKLLIESNFIAAKDGYTELDTDNTRLNSRQEWKTFWFDKQRLLINPNTNAMRDAVEIALAAQKHRKRTNRRGTKKPKKT